MEELLQTLQIFRDKFSGSEIFYSRNLLIFRFKIFFKFLIWNNPKIFNFLNFYEIYNLENTTNFYFNKLSYILSVRTIQTNIEIEYKVAKKIK